MRIAVQDLKPTNRFSDRYENRPFEFSKKRLEVDNIIHRISNGTSAISQYWRKNVSNNETEELSNALRGILKVLGYLGTNAGSVEWYGMSKNTDRSVTVLEPDLVLGKYPVDFKKFDYLTGIAIHEAMLRTEWSDLVWKQTEGKYSNFSREKLILHKYIQAGEHVYLTHFFKKSVLLKYLIFKIQVDKEMSDCQEANFSETAIDSLFDIWFYQSCNIASQKCQSGYEKPLAFLKMNSGRLDEIASCKKGVIERCKLRTELYHESLPKLLPLIKNWKIKNKELLWYSVPEPRLSTKHSDTLKTKKRKLSDAVLSNIEERMAIMSSDLTPVIKSAVDCENEEIVATSRWDFDIPANPIIDIDSVKRLKSILIHYADRKTVVSRGLTTGKIDRRRLYRAPVNGKSFYDIQKVPVMDWNICILVDATGSMTGKKWQMVINTLGTIHKSFSGFQHRLQGFAYFEVEGVCMVSNLIKNNSLLSIPPSGQTASGQAIIAAAHLMNTERGRNFLIHLTDGESNLGCHVKYGINYCEKNNISLVTLGIGCKNRDTMKNQYGRGIQFIDHFGNLPTVMETLFKWALLYKKGNKVQLKLEGNDDK